MKLRTLRLLAAVAVICFLSACGKYSISPEKNSAAAAAYIDQVLLMNRGLMNFKGIGRVALRHYGQNLHARMVWASSLPDKLRMDIMGAPGVVLATLASDGKWVYLLLEKENRFYKKQSGKALFRGLVDIPITVSEAAQILAGKIPVYSHQYAKIVSNNSDSKKFSLELKDRWGKTCQRIFFDQQRNGPIGFEIVRQDGSISYRTEFLEMTDLEKYRVPKYMVMSNSEGERLELKVEKYWINKSLPESRYTLTPRG